ncbi:hypothetical protein GOP47_0003555 [Adiantum capillus-veneris]|uniref:Uncharacterized protein n=1 Tax=Adiantum capillus-veneris TaxID=13818 RepID=A0A9D4ZSE7_ADICA|nr:hypothetical protein GOP47_0003555 [Adiantum capillus-veneris]
MERSGFDLRQRAVRKPIKVLRFNAYLASSQLLLAEWGCRVRSIRGGVKDNKIVLTLSHKEDKDSKPHRSQSFLYTTAFFVQLPKESRGVTNLNALQFIDTTFALISGLVP